MRKSSIAVVGALAALAAAAAPTHAADRPQTIPLPNGWQPEGIAAQGSQLYAGSLANGAVYTVDVKGGDRGVAIPGQQGRAVAGIKVSGSTVYMSGASTGDVLVGDLRSGTVRTYDVGGGFVNDVALLGGSAYFTDSVKPQLYVLPRHGDQAPTALPITGDLVYDTSPGAFNANGIVAAGDELIVVQSSTGKLFRIDPDTGVSREIDLGGATLPRGDGLLLQGRTLYVVQNTLNQIGVVTLAPDRASGTVGTPITDQDFRVPTTIARAGGDLYAVNARFGTPPGPGTDYDIVRVG